MAGFDQLQMNTNRINFIVGFLLLLKCTGKN